MPQKYSNGKIYTIRNRLDNEMIYVGSTIDRLCNRFAKHKYESKRNPNIYFYSFVSNWDDWYIELYENIKCENKEQLLKREGDVMREIGTLNKVIAGNSISISEQDYMKRYREENKEKISELKLLNYIQNKEVILEKSKIRYEINKKKVKCSCGYFTSKHHMKRHEKSQKHINLIEILNNTQNNIEISS